MRSTLDKLISWTGLGLAVVMLVAGVLLTWASSFVASNVREQLLDQHIVMPAAAALTTQTMKDNLTQYAGQNMETGAQAKAYADYYIQEHLNASSGGKTYSEVSNAALAAQKADPQMQQDATKKLMDLRQTMFMGDTLRGLLLYAYAFGTMGIIAGYAAIGAYVAAALFLVLGILGLRHAKRATAPVVANA